MLFNSYIFIFIFLPLAFGGYFLLNYFKQYNIAKVFLVGMSLWFYSYFHLSYLWIMLFSIIVNYVCHLTMIKGMCPKISLFLGVIFNVSILFYYKYFDFFLENINNLFHLDYSLLGVLMPLGISFFTFQQIAFLVDTYKGDVLKQNIVDYMLFVSFFPQLIAGPIVNHKEMLPQFQDIQKKRICFEYIYKGIAIFVLGLAKKVILADTMGAAVDWGFRYYTVLDGLNTFLIIILYTLQIYFDFSGYCDMARGIGYLFNIDIPVNFLSPYKARNIVEFWERWHITLTRFFTRYVYIPLGGNRKGAMRTYVNVFLVFLISGIWHGAGWTYIIWGMMHGILSVFTRIWLGIKKAVLSGKQIMLSSNRVWRILTQGLSVCLTFLFVSLAWTFFRADTPEQAMYMINKVFSFEGTRVYTEIADCFRLTEFWFVVRALDLEEAPFIAYTYFVLFAMVSVAIVFAGKNIKELEKVHRPNCISSLCLAALFAWCILSLSGVSTFLYFNF